MSDFVQRLASHVAPPTRLVTGVVIDAASGGWRVVLADGTRPQVMVAGSYVPQHGDTVLVMMIGRIAVTWGPVSAAPRPLTGLVAGYTASLVTLSTSSGQVQARYVGAAPSVGASVRIVWDAAIPWVLPGTASSAPPKPSVTVPQPPAGATSGTITVAAVDSGTFESGRDWIAGADRLIQGAAAGSPWTNTGAWFYGAAFAALRGCTVTGANLRLPDRLAGGAAQSQTLHIRRHTSQSRPAGTAVAFAGTTLDVSVADRQSSRWVALPTAIAQGLVDSGGGLGIVGDPLIILAGLGTDLLSGQLAITYTV